MVIPVLSYFMTIAMLWCFVRHGIYPAIRCVVRMIIAIVRFLARKLRRPDRDVLPVQRVLVRRLIGTPVSESVVIEA